MSSICLLGHLHLTSDLRFHMLGWLTGGKHFGLPKILGEASVIPQWNVSSYCLFFETFWCLREDWRVTEMKWRWLTIHNCNQSQHGQLCTLNAGSEILKVAVKLSQTPIFNSIHRRRSYTNRRSIWSTWYFSVHHLYRKACLALSRGIAWLNS